MKKKDKLERLVDRWMRASTPDQRRHLVLEKVRLEMEQTAPPKNGMDHVPITHP